MLICDFPAFHHPVSSHPDPILTQGHQLQRKARLDPKRKVYWQTEVCTQQQSGQVCVGLCGNTCQGAWLCMYVPSRNDGPGYLGQIQAVVAASLCFIVLTWSVGVGQKTLRIRGSVCAGTSVGSPAPPSRPKQSII